MPASAKTSSNGGTDFIRPDRKFEVELLPLAPLPLSQTVTLSILIFLIAST